MVKTAVFAMSLAILTVTSPFVTKTAIAQEDLASVKADRDHLRDRLRRAIAVSKERGAKLEAAEAGRNDLRDRLRRAVAFSKERGKKLETAETGRDFLRGRLGRAVAVSKERGKNLKAAEAGRSDLSGRLRRAIAFSKERGDKLEAAEADRSHLRDRLRRAIAFSKSSRADLQQQLASANASSDTAAWASAVGSSLQSSIGGLQGTEVSTTSNNAVKVQLGNIGLFRTGGNALSASGQTLLADIAPQLLAQNATYTIVGHTDNIPVGAGNPFGSNEALSFARAQSTLEFLRTQGIPAQRISAAGFGADEPIAGNDTEEGRQQNRRVDIILRAQ